SGELPLVMSPDETLLTVASSLKARVQLSLGYGCGLRASEVVRLKVKHIDSAQKIIRIEQSVAAWVEATPLAPRCTNTCAGTLAVSRLQARHADDHPPSQPVIP